MKTNYENYHQEENTKCDLCNQKNKCTLIQCTRLNDTKVHYIPADGNICHNDGSLGIVYTLNLLCEVFHCDLDTAFSMIRHEIVPGAKTTEGVWVIYPQELYVKQ